MAIIVYTRHACPLCTVAKRYLDAKGIEFTEINVQDNPTIAQQLAHKVGTQLPIIDIDGVFISGFSKEKVEEALRAAGRL